MMALPSKEVIDLTIDDEEDDQKLQQPLLAPAFRNGTTEGRDFLDDGNLVSRVDPTSYGSTYAHSDGRRRPAPAQAFHRSIAPATPFAAPPPAKRQKVSGSAHSRLTHDEVVSKSVGIYLSTYARAAVEPFKNKGLDEDKLKAEVSQPHRTLATGRHY
jgi:hypothetical protein